MNDKQVAELQELQNLEAAGTLNDTQKVRLEELLTFQGLVEKTADFDKKSKDLDSALAQKDHFRTKAEKAEQEKKDLEAKLKGSADKSSLGVEDYIDISSSLHGLDSREQAYLASQHKLTNKPLAEIRKSEDFAFWQSSYRAKVEKEKLAIPPTNKQPDSNEPISLEQALNEARTPEEKEKVLIEAGLYKENKPRADRVIIGR